MASSGLAELVRPLEHDVRLDTQAGRLRPLAARLDSGKLGAVLRGEWLGHPVHPLLTDLPIGFWTSAWMLDMVGGQRSRDAATRLVGLGVLSAVPTAAAGAVDWHHMDDHGKVRVGVLHAAANAATTALYLGSWWARRRGRHATGVALGMVAAGTATFAGYLGGHLAFGESDGDTA
jgi:uncharacterized membrane protein